MTRLAAVVLTLATVAVVLVAPARAAAPRYILVSGPGLQRPLVLGNWSENLAFLTELLSAPQPARGWRAKRRRYDLALFWRVPGRPVPTDPEKANQHGWFYPAIRGRRAVVVLGIGGRDRPRVTAPEALWTLARHGVPPRV